ncbi:hypothetical protein JOD54_002425 [Actinokineospora baliensis]|uniref:hypothetical protein n=1 Tax=Actinokineospora baliensis TaxID=547056 RepID=UPI00195AA908|nr:hypothetical protein [Actinokineospora baliensis]MBM7772221.1 hypothetical protein [Actinokineospora baliensis]
MIITIGTNDGYDLDSISSEEGRTAPVGSKADIRLVGELTSAQKITAGKPASSYADCVNSPQRRGLPPAELKAGSAFCVETTEGRWARLAIADVRVEATKTEVDLNVTVWDKPA